MSELDLTACLAAFDAAAVKKQERAQSMAQCANEVCAAVLSALPQALAVWAGQPDPESRVFVEVDTQKLSQYGAGWSLELERALLGATGIEWDVGSTFVSAEALTLESAIRRMAEATAQEEAPCQN